MRDLAAVKAASAALAYEAALVAHVSDAIIGLDKCGLVTSWNPAAEAIYGWSGPDLLLLEYQGRLMSDEVEEATSQTSPLGGFIERPKDPN